MEKAIYALILVFLALCAYQDIRTKQLSLKLICPFAAIIIAIAIALGLFSDWLIVLKIAPGLFLLFLAFLTHEAIGYGDGIVLTLIGILIPLELSLPFLLAAFLLSAVASLILLITKKGNRETKMPFMPFLLLAWLLLLFK